MLELGSVQDMTHGNNLTASISERDANTMQAAETKKVLDDAAIAEIHKPLNESPDEHQDDKHTIQDILSLGRSMRECIREFRERLAKLKNQADEMADGRFTAGNLAEDFHDQIEEILGYDSEPKQRIYSDVSEKLTRIREEIKAIQSFDGFLLGVHDKIEEISEQTEFTLEQIPEVLENIAERHQSLELDRFSLTRIQEEARKALRGQANISGDRAFKLLENSV